MLWSTDGDGTFDTSNTDVNATYIPGNNDRIVGNVRLVLKALNNQGCTDVEEEIILTINSAPQISLSANNISACSSDTQVQLSGNTITDNGLIIWSSSGTGDFVNDAVQNPIYEPTVEDKANGQVILSVEAQPSNNCSQSAFDTVTITFVDGVVVEAGQSETICEGENYQILGASVTNQSSFSWSTSGDGSFIGADTVSPEYIPGTNDISTGSVILTLTANGISGCSASDSDTLLLNINQNAFADTGITATEICASDNLNLTGIAENYSSIEWFTDGDGRFSNELNLTTVYSPGPNDLANGGAVLTLVAYAQSPCTTNTSSAVNLSIVPTLDVSAGDDDSICQGSPYSLSGASITNSQTNTAASNTDYQNILWTTTGTGSFSSSNSLNPTYSPSQNDYQIGSVTLIMEVTPSNACDAGTTLDATMTLTFNGVISGTGIIEGLPTLCEGTGPYNYQVTGLTGVTDYTWQVNSPLATITTLANTAQVSLEFDAAGTYILSATPSNDCGLGTSITKTVTVNPDGVITHDTAQGALDQPLCEGEAIETISFSLSGGATGATILWDVVPSGINFDPVALTISGTPTDDVTSVATYTYTVTTTGSGCEPDDISGVITVNPLDELELTTTSNNTAVECSATAITPIQYTLGGGATGATISWDVDPVSITFDSATTTVSGTAPTVTTTTTYTYTLISTGGSCPDTATGTITVNPDGVITHDTAQGALDQTLCEGEAIETISFSLSGGATGATILWDVVPSGINFDPVALTISGTPTDDVTSVATYTYTVTTTGSGCEPDDISGVITVNPLDELELTTTSNNTAVECSATAITPIQYTLGGGATGATISWDVDPVSITFDSATTTISGTAPTVTTTTTYTYTLISTGGSCPDTATGTITVNPDDEISLTSANSSQTGLCEGEAIQDITYALAGGATGATVSGLPNGVTYTVNAGLVTISGIPTENILGSFTSFDFNVVTTGSCNPQTRNGTIRINSDHSMFADPGLTTQEICEGDSIDPIDFTVSNGATSAILVGAPDGIVITPEGGNVFRVSGSVNENIGTSSIYNFSVTTQGNGCTAAPIPVSIEVNPDQELNLTSSNAVQEICEGESIQDITYALAGVQLELLLLDYQMA